MSENLLSEIQTEFEEFKKLISKKYNVEFDNLGGITYIYFSQNHPKYKVELFCKDVTTNCIGKIDTDKRLYRKQK